jgi:hypothetical protein
MTTPVFDEDYIIALLRMPPIDDHIGAIQNGAMQALIDLYDRKATREEFIDNASTCVTLYGHIAKMWLLRNIEIVYDNGSLDANQFKIAREGLTDVVRKQSEAVVDLVKRLKMCPATEDKVH